MEEVIVRYFHFIGILLLASTLVLEHLLIEKEMSKKTFKKLVIVDGIYGVSALVVLATGLLLLLAVGKPKEFYTENFVFHIKMTGFVLMAVLSIVPTVFFIKNRNFSGESITLPRHLIGIVRAEKAVLLIMPLLAVFMSRGIGL
ncbi:DUF2214 family protein [Catenovulum sediminis]|uniref:DUF2214 family protein n=1 Tax=Catenovulum sediminis TaxID=1740262 RepID=A0ABV1RG84_9ALTE